jgi:hypothetical protein
VQGIIQQEQSSPHQQGSLTPGVIRLIAVADDEEVAEEEVEGVERAVVVEVVRTCLGILASCGCWLGLGGRAGKWSVSWLFGCRVDIEVEDGMEKEGEEEEGAAYSFVANSLSRSSVSVSESQGQSFLNVSGTC